MDDKDLINVNKFRTLTGKDMYDIEFNQSFLFIFKTSMSYLVGLLFGNFFLKLLELIIPNTKYKKIIIIISIFIFIILITFLAIIAITNYEIKLKQNEKLRNIAN
jgi:hypothetical protein